MSERRQGLGRAAPGADEPAGTRADRDATVGGRNADEPGDGGTADDHPDDESGTDAGRPGAGQDEKDEAGDDDREPPPQGEVAGSPPAGGWWRPGEWVPRALRRRLSERAERVDDAPIEGVARVDRKTKRLVKRLAPGEVAIIDHADLDRVAAETLVEAEPAAVVNAARSITGRYPNLGPLLLCQAGIPLIDDVGPELLEVVHEGDPVAVVGGDIIVGGAVVASGTRQTTESVDQAMIEARANIGPELERFATNTVEYVRDEVGVLTGDIDVPDVDVDIAGRHALIVVRGFDYKEDLALLRRSGYIKEVRPVLIGVDGGADALMEIGFTPDIIIGDFDSVTEETLRCGAQLVVHGFVDGRTPGAKRLDELGLDYTVFRAPGTSEDIAMLLADAKGADLLVAVGTHFSMVEFLDKGRAGMASTILVRMKLGSRLVDAKGVSRLYHHSVRTSDLLWLIVSAIFTLAVALVLSEPVRLVLRAFWRSLIS
ncbi:MAG TPA: putative cytokinetic ring protein SteA [Acidimicrobiales bacterium]